MPPMEIPVAEVAPMKKKKPKRNGKIVTMCAARINIKNIDYFKFKKLVIDANRDDYNSSSKEVKTLCDSVQVRSYFLFR